MNCWGSSIAERQDRNLEVVRCNSAPPAPLLSGHQPVFLPGIILFNKIAMSDVFMFCGHCQFRHRSWHVRNYIRQSNDRIALTVPVLKKFPQSINEVAIDDSKNWRRKHLDSIEQTYAKRPFFNEYFPGLESIYLMNTNSLSHFNEMLIILAVSWLGIQTEMLFSHGIEGHKTDMLVNMCKEVGAGSYLSSPGEIAYVDRATFKRNKLGHRYQQFTHPVYEQGREFIPNLSIIDLVFNCGPRSGDIVRNAGSHD